MNITTEARSLNVGSTPTLGTINSLLKTYRYD